MLDAEHSEPWIVCNVFIKQYYRPTRIGWRESVRSMYAYWHNETINIYTHLIPLIFALIYCPIDVYDIYDEGGVFPALVHLLQVCTGGCITTSCI